MHDSEDSFDKCKLIGRDVVIRGTCSANEYSIQPQDEFKGP